MVVNCGSEVVVGCDGGYGYNSCSGFVVVGLIADNLLYFLSMQWAGGVAG